jgi:glycosyltransferase involved in cell wall biosynthesis
MNNKNLCLFFTRGVSLKSWLESGLFEREKQIYEAHLNSGVLKSVVWLTYGSEDFLIANRLKMQGQLHVDIAVIQMPRVFNFLLGSWIYSLLLPFIHARVIKKCDIYKTNQMDGSWTAVLAKFLYRKPLLLRTGYTQSIFLKKKNKNSFILWLSSAVELFAYRSCSLGIVSSYQDKYYLIKKYNLASNKVKVIHNYINTEFFKPKESVKYKNRVVFVGRLNKQKNLINLIDAIIQTNLTLDIYGEGELRDALQSHAANKGAKVNFLGVVNNNELPDLLNQYKYYILPSLFEGMPKTLLEAMSCSLVCIGTNANGINEVIDDGVNGFLSTGFDATNLVDVINKVLAYENIDDIAYQARSLVVDRYSLPYVQQKEKEVLASV